MFQFTADGGKAREEANAIKDDLSAAIQTAKSVQQPDRTTSTTDGAREGGMKVAVSTTAQPSSWNDNNRLKADAELQQSLLRSDPNLQRMFMESLRSKPETLTAAQFMSQFWTTRLHLLRAHAIERSQTRGSYNVLSTLKPRVEDNVTKLNISKEQIQLIFAQHPLVKRVYDENVPKLTEQQFWSRFFQSRLFKKLRGERVTEADATDAILDKYLQQHDNISGAQRQGEEEARKNGDNREVHVPHFIDLAGNEDDISQRMGNRPDIDMRPTSMPIVRTLNRLSERIMGNVSQVDHDPATETAADADEEALEELQLHDLQGERQQSRVTLNIRDQSRFFAQAQFAEDYDSRLFAEQDPIKVITDLRADVVETLPGDGSAQLDRLVEPEEEEDEEEEEEEEEEEHNDDGKKQNQQQQLQQVGSKISLQKATSQILSAIRDRRAQEAEQQANSANTPSTENTYGLSPSLFDRLTITHATTTEFLHQFWQTFLSGNADRAGELASLVESLHRAVDRIRAVAKDAEAERQVEVERRKGQAREVLEATGRRIRVNLAGIGGGEEVVDQLLGPTNTAIEGALGKYQDALKMAQREAGEAGK